MLLVVVYAYLITHPQRAGAWSAVEAWFGRRFPKAWNAVRGVASRAGRRRLGLAGLVVLFWVIGYAFGEVAESWQDRGYLFAIDQRVYEALAESSDPALERFFAKFTHLGSIYVAAALSGAMLALLLYRRQKLQVLGLGLVMGVGEVLAWGLKLVFARERPSDTLVQAAGDAFPSGHAFTGTALYGFIIYLVWANTTRPLIRAILTAVLGAIAIMVGLSRVLLRVHWFSDVLGGFALGLGWLVCSLLLLHVLREPAPRGAVDTS
jgi:undecaprenyl-diphosphatase